MLGLRWWRGRWTIGRGSVPHGVALGRAHSESRAAGGLASLGRGYLRLAARVWPAVGAHLPPDAEIARPVVLGVLAAVSGLSAEQTARLTGYDDVQTIAAAALKLLPVDPREATGWVTSLYPDIQQLAADLADLTDPALIPGPGAPLIDALAELHATRGIRLFHA